MSGVTFVKIKPEDDGIRLNRWFLKEYPSLTLGRLQKLLRTKQIKVDGKKAEANTRLSAGQELRLPPLDNEKAIKNPDVVSKSDTDFIQSMIIFKDDNIIVLNKPSGLAVQGGTNTDRHIDGMLEALKFENSEKPKLVHRIDKDTSGVLVLARNRRYAELLTKAFREHMLQKTYLVLAIGNLKNPEGEIKIALDKVGEKMEPSDEGKKAVTRFKVLDTAGEKFTLLTAEPLTGRTHQIRAHMECAGCPILGDNKYFGQSRKRFPELSSKLHLHAYKIDLSPVYNKKLVVKAPLPDYFKNDIKFLGLNFKEK
ncbi:MAG: RluA family pseudouridine synthase [Alphaproteobacteria bacterium]|nr:RluA family pseudouridine synthase [Alphaproteobacteria bacterium]